MGRYELDIEGDKVKVNVIDHAALVDNQINELRNLLRRRRVAGLDVKFHPRRSGKAEMLILCVETRCLIIQVGYLGSIPESLKKFLADEAICFVGMGMKGKVGSLGRCSLRCKTGVEMGDLAARVLKKPHISSFGLAKLAREVGIRSVASGSCSSASAPSWNARAFSNEQIRFAIHEAYAFCVIGNKLLGSLDA